MLGRTAGSYQETSLMATSWASSVVRVPKSELFAKRRLKFNWCQFARNAKGIPFPDELSSSAKVNYDDVRLQRTDLY